MKLRRFPYAHSLKITEEPVVKFIGPGAQHHQGRPAEVVLAGALVYRELALAWAQPDLGDR